MSWTMFLLLFAISLHIGTVIVHCRMVRNSKDALEYLERFGYINRSTAAALEEMPEKSRQDKMRDNLEMFQMFSGTKVTGVMDKGTMKMMNAIRCGNKENMKVMKNEQLSTSGMYKVNVAWEHLDLTYRIINYPRTGLNPSLVKRDIRRAFDLWQAVSNLTCNEIDKDAPNSKADIEISFVTGPHNDNMPFIKRPSGTPVAHAFYPHQHHHTHHLRGQIHFDSTRGWTVESEDGINFFQIATHEIGHSLGLEHSTAKYSIMHPLPPVRYDPNFSLHSDDIKGIQILYGKREDKDWGLANTGIVSGGEDLETSESVYRAPNVNHYSELFQNARKKENKAGAGLVESTKKGEPRTHLQHPHPTIVNNIFIVYHFQPFAYLWNCRQLGLLQEDNSDSLACYEQMTKHLLQHRRV